MGAHPGQHALSPFSEQGPSDSPFAIPAGSRRATVPHDSSGPTAPIFASPFGAAAGGVIRDPSPFSSDGPGFTSPFGQQGPTSPADAHDEPPVPSYALGRRTSVSAESLVPTNQRSLPPGLDSTMEEDESAVTPASAATPSFPKSPEQLQRIRDAISPNFLFRNLDDEQEADVLAAMKEVTLGPNEIVIEQGAAGDYFYVVESGELNIFVKRDGQVIDADKGDDPVLGKKVATSVKGNSFGELALMHK